MTLVEEHDRCVAGGFSPQPWGEHGVLLRFAGASYVIRGLARSQQEALRRRYPCESLEANAQTASADIVETLVFRLERLTQTPDVYTTDGFYTPLITRRGDYLRIEGHGFLADAQLRSALAGRFWAADHDLVTTPLAFENYLRILAAYASLMKGGAMLHSAGVVAGGRAWLFLGRSGAGKTTISRLALAAGAGVLSDDINIVLPDAEGRFHVGAVPFAGELGASRLVQTGAFPLGGLFWLQKGNGSGERQSPALAAQLARFYACCPVVNADGTEIDSILDVAKSMLTVRPLHDFTFDLGESFDSILERAKAIQCKTTHP